jgi:signal peptidase I
MEVTREDLAKLKKNPFFKGVIVSDSMEPLIMVGDRIIVEVGNMDLERFDIVVFFSDGKLVCHYLWAMNQIVKPILFQTRSLKYGNKDFPLSFDDYLGKVVSHHLSSMDKLKIILSQIFRSK